MAQECLDPYCCARNTVVDDEFRAKVITTWSVGIPSGSTDRDAAIARVPEVIPGYQRLNSQVLVVNDDFLIVRTIDCEPGYQQPSVVDPRL